MKKFFDPRDRSDADYQRDVDIGKIDAFRRSDVGGVYTYQTASDGSTIIKDVEPASNDKGHQQTDFVVRDGRITSMKSHND